MGAEKKCRLPRKYHAPFSAGMFMSAIKSGTDTVLVWLEYRLVQQADPGAGKKSSITLYIVGIGLGTWPGIVYSFWGVMAGGTHHGQARNT